MSVSKPQIPSGGLSSSQGKCAPSASDSVLRHLRSGISVIIVGSGIGRLTAAVCTNFGEQKRSYVRPLFELQDMSREQETLHMPFELR